MVPIFLWLCCCILPCQGGNSGGGTPFLLLKSLVLLCTRAAPWLRPFCANSGAVCTACNKGKAGDFFFSVVREGVADKPQAPFYVVLAEGSGIALGLDAESGSSWIPAWNYLLCSAHWMGRGLGSQGEPPVLPFWYRNGCG